MWFERSRPTSSVDVDNICIAKTACETTERLRKPSTRVIIRTCDNEKKNYRTMRVKHVNAVRFTSFHGHRRIRVVHTTTTTTIRKTANAVARAGRPTNATEKRPTPPLSYRTRIINETTSTKSRLVARKLRRTKKKKIKRYSLDMVWRGLARVRPWDGDCDPCNSGERDTATASDGQNKTTWTATPIERSRRARRK